MMLVSGSTRSVRDLAAREDVSGKLGLLLTPANRNSVRAAAATGLPWAVDNGCYAGFDERRFRRLLVRAAGQPNCLFVVCPDVVADASATIALFRQWRPLLRDWGLPIAFVGQDGAEDLDVPWRQFSTWFVGGSTRWKLSQASGDLMVEAKRRGKHVHVGRVNSERRLRWCFDQGADSCDGSSLSRFGDKYIHKFVRWIVRLHGQPLLFQTPAGGKHVHGR